MDTDELHVLVLLHASNDLSRARAIFAAEKARRPRGRFGTTNGRPHFNNVAGICDGQRARLWNLVEKRSPQSHRAPANTGSKDFT